MLRLAGEVVTQLQRTRPGVRHDGAGILDVMSDANTTSTVPDPPEQWQHDEQAAVTVRLLNQSLSADLARLRSRLATGVLEGRGLTLDVSAVDDFSSPDGGRHPLGAAQLRRTQPPLHRHRAPGPQPSHHALLRSARPGATAMNRVVGDAW